MNIEHQITRGFYEIISDIRINKRAMNRFSQESFGIELDDECFLKLTYDNCRLIIEKRIKDLEEENWELTELKRVLPLIPKNKKENDLS